MDNSEQYISQSNLFTKYKSSNILMLKDFITHFIVLLSTIYCTWYFRNTYINIIIIPLLGLLLNRTFIVFHDCVHNSYSPNNKLNYILSLIFGTFVITSPNWILDHHTHHQTNGNITNLYKYFFNETIILTVNKYTKLSTKYKLLYKIYKHPLVFFTIVPFLYFFIVQRFIYFYKKINHIDKIRDTLINITFNHLFNNIAICILFYYLYKYEILYHYIIALCIGNSISFMIFHNQHSYNPAYVVTDENWNMKDSGLKGSSFIQVPYFLKYFYAGIEYHHIHHMNAKIPGYNLQGYHEEVINNTEWFNNITKLSIIDCYNNLWLILYSEKQNKYLTSEETDKEIEESKLL
jgi:omega-6 fatty acid desaturase (delta-12 desaturase)